MRRFTLPNLFLTVEGEDDDEADENVKTEEEGVYHHEDTPRSSPREVKEVDLADGSSPSSPRTPASPRRIATANHCPVHCPHKTKLVQEELGNRVAAETVPEEEEEEDTETGGPSKADTTAALSAMTLNSSNNKSTRHNDDTTSDRDTNVNEVLEAGGIEEANNDVISIEKTGDGSGLSTQSESDETKMASSKLKMTRVPKSPKSPRSPVNPRYLKMFQLTSGALSEDPLGRSGTGACTCPNSCVQDFGLQEVPTRPGLAFGENLRARIDGYRRQDSGVVGVPREKRSHSLAAPGSLELPGCRRGFRPEALLVRSATGTGCSLVKAQFKNRHQLSVQASLEFSDDAIGFPGTPPPQATPPVHKDIPIMTSKVPKNRSKDFGMLPNQLTIDPSMLGRTSSWEDYSADEGSKSDNEIEKSSNESPKREVSN
ncbi:uncharacterized protein LOC108672018 [Hyalella azteca]|uniref:Uncharacterized protein LOC108672018 n=1 Tax=Hyalella azteca TaxID=294128 RepID=A0A8B7NN58_HYAAZ|nr:uncharacterized protein LOC108672018 [Hyalella azteca]